MSWNQCCYDVKAELTECQRALIRVSNDLVEARAELARVRAERDALKTACKAGLAWIRGNFPPPAHPGLGFCGLESNCDAGCIEVAEAYQVVSHLSAALEAAPRGATS